MLARRRVPVRPSATHIVLILGLLGLFGLPRARAAGTTLDDAFRSNSTMISYPTNPSVARDADGDFVIAWHSIYRHGSTGIYAQRYTPAGGRRGGELRVNTRQSTPAWRWMPT